MTTLQETRFLGVEQCPNSEAVHVVPMTITSSIPLTTLETPGNITAAEPCPFCYPHSRPIEDGTL